MKAKSSDRLPITVSNPDKVFWPEEGYTKLDLVEFYDAVFPRLAPFVKDRMLSLERCPDGMRGECFFQKEKPKGLPQGTRTTRIRHEKGTTNYVVGGSRVTHLSLVNLGCLSFHIFNSRAASPRRPDWVCFDLDPGSEEFAAVARAALRVKEALDALHLVSFAKTSGGRGLHIFVPIRVGPDTDQVLAFAKTLVARVAAAHPKELTVEQPRAARRGRVYLDPFRNGFAQTVVAPYSPRRRPGAPVSAPLDWPEVKTTLVPSDFNLGNFKKRLREPDPWEGFFERRQSLTQAMRAVQRL